MSKILCNNNKKKKKTEKKIYYAIYNILAGYNNLFQTSVFRSQDYEKKSKSKSQNLTKKSLHMKQYYIDGAKMIFRFISNKGAQDVVQRELKTDKNINKK